MDGPAVSLLLNHPPDLPRAKFAEAGSFFLGIDLLQLVEWHDISAPVSAGEPSNLRPDARTLISTCLSAHMQLI